MRYSAGAWSWIRTTKSVRESATRCLSVSLFRVITGGCGRDALYHMPAIDIRFAGAGGLFPAGEKIGPEESRRGFVIDHPLSQLQAANRIRVISAGRQAGLSPGSISQEVGGPPLRRLLVLAPNHLRSPRARDYSSRREQWRLMLLILPLGLVILLMARLREPQTAERLTIYSTGDAVRRSFRRTEPEEADSRPSATAGRRKRTPAPAEAQRRGHSSIRRTRTEACQDVATTPTSATPRRTPGSTS